MTAANILLTENGDVKVLLSWLQKFMIPGDFWIVNCVNILLQFFPFHLIQVADFGVSAQLTRTISRRKVLFFFPEILTLA